jgi:hypothetical protein
VANAFQHNAFQPGAFQDNLVSGVLYAIDQNDSGSFAGTVVASGTVDTHDGFTREEIRRAKRLDKKNQGSRVKKN